MRKKLLEVIRHSAIDQNATFVQLLGMCPTLAVTTSAKNGFSMGIAVTLVLILSGLIISLLRKFIPASVRIVSYIVIISAFVTAIQLLIKAFLPEIDAALGIFIPLIVVNCIILGRAEAFASRNTPLLSMADGLGTGLGFAMALTLVGAIRELLGSGTLLAGTPLEIRVPLYEPMLIFVLPAGAFLTLGFVTAGVNYLRLRKNEKNAKKEETL